MRKYSIFITLLLFAANFASPFSFSPIIKDFESSGRGRIQTFRIKNENDEPIAVQITMLTRNMGSMGEEINGDASDMFTIYPHQLILQPDDFQSVRVQWNGPEKNERELAFRIVAEQLPIGFNGEQINKGQLNIVYRYVGSVYVLPENPRSDLVLDSVTSANGRIEFRIVNQGNSHTILEDPAITLSDGVHSVTLQYQDLPGIAGENILAGVFRYFTIAKPPQLSGDKISGALSYKETR